jgi:hypothetical protein
MPTPEQHKGPEHSGEQPRDLERAPELLDKKAEISAESKEEHEKHVEQARADVEQEAVSGRETSQGEHKKSDDGPVRVVHRSRKESYQHTMKNVQSEMSAPARVFSKVIHNPIVERTSEVIGSTVARPDAILSGSVFAFLLVLGLYILARYNGFELRGSETIIAFVIGWIIGIVFDFLRAMITGKRQ